MNIQSVTKAKSIANILFAVLFIATMIFAWTYEYSAILKNQSTMEHEEAKAYGVAMMVYYLFGVLILGFILIPSAILSLIASIKFGKYYRTLSIAKGAFIFDLIAKGLACFYTILCAGATQGALWAKLIYASVFIFALLSFIFNICCLSNLSKRKE